MRISDREIRFRLIPQVMLLFALGILVTGITTFLTQRALSESAIQEQIENLAQEIAGEAAASIREYPASDYLLSYWYAHGDELEIEYDAEYGTGTETEKKCRLLAQHCPDLQLRYATPGELETLAPEDQKLYAEITYAWLITRLNQIKRAYQIDYLFCVATDETFGTQFFLLSAADPGAVRGTSYEEVYPLGHVVTVGPDQQAAMRSAQANASHLADAGDYVDYYLSLGENRDHPVFIGMTYNLSDIRAASASLARREMLFAMLHQVFLSLICLLLIYYFVLHPLKKVQGNIRLYKQSKDSRTITESLNEIRTHNEIGDLARDVTELSVEMDDFIGRIETITAEKERVSTELNMATQIQEGMLPNIYPAFPDRPEFDIYATMDPAREVGGDFYDFFLVDEDHLCMVMADVSGKGVPAALFMMASKIILANNAMMGKSPARILADTNAAICSNNKMEMFVTVWLGILEISTGKLVAANAGHEYPVIKRRDSAFELLKDKHGFVIGGMEGMKYREYGLTLLPGEKLFLYTDGVPEATNPENEMFGTARMLEALNGSGDATTVEILKNVRASVDAFARGAEQFDDLTMLCLDYKGPSPANELTLEAASQNLPQVQAFLEDCLASADCPAKARTQLCIAAEEIFVNIASYAYAPGTGNVTVHVEVSGEPPAATVTFTDQGVAYDPLSKDDPDVTLPAEAREIGGLGIFMTKKLMDNVTYARRDGSNILTISKKL